LLVRRLGRIESIDQPEGLEGFTRRIVWKAWKTSAAGRLGNPLQLEGLEKVKTENTKSKRRSRRLQKLGQN
jgi:hypothetical protein